MSFKSVLLQRNITYIEKTWILIEYDQPLFPLKLLQRAELFILIGFKCERQGQAWEFTKC